MFVVQFTSIKSPESYNSVYIQLLAIAIDPYVNSDCGGMLYYICFTGQKVSVHPHHFRDGSNTWALD